MSDFDGLTCPTPSEELMRAIARIRGNLSVAEDAAKKMAVSEGETHHVARVVVDWCRKAGADPSEFVVEFALQDMADMAEAVRQAALAVPA